MKCSQCNGELDAYLTRTGPSSDEACAQCEPWKFVERTACDHCGLLIRSENFDPDHHLVSCNRCGDKLLESSMSSDGQNCIECADILSKNECLICGSLVSESLVYGTSCNQCFQEKQNTDSYGDFND